MPNATPPPRARTTVRHARDRMAAASPAAAPPEADASPLLLSDRAAAFWLGLSRASLWRRVADGTLPQPVRIGGVTRWRRDELLAAVEAASAQRSNPNEEVA